MYNNERWCPVTSWYAQADAMDEIQEGDEDEHFDSEGEGSLREAHHAAPTNGSAAASTAHAAAAPDLHHHHTTRVDTPPAPAPAKPPSLLVPQDSFDAHAGNGSRGLVSAASLPAPESMRCKEPIKRGRFEISDQDEDGGSPPSAQNVTSPSSADLSDTAGPAPASAAPYRPTQSVPNLHVDLSVRLIVSSLSSPFCSSLVTAWLWLVARYSNFQRHTRACAQSLLLLPPLSLLPE